MRPMMPTLKQNKIYQHLLKCYNNTLKEGAVAYHSAHCEGFSHGSEGRRHVPVDFEVVGFGAWAYCYNICMREEECYNICMREEKCYNICMREEECYNICMRE